MMAMKTMMKTMMTIIQVLVLATTAVGMHTGMENSGCAMIVEDVSNNIK